MIKNGGVNLIDFQSIKLNYANNDNPQRGKKPLFQTVLILIKNFNE